MGSKVKKNSIASPYVLDIGYDMSNKKEKNRPEDIAYSLYLYFLGLSLRNTYKAMSRFVKRGHIAIRDWIQKYKPQKILTKKRKIEKFIIDETLIKVGSEFIWLWVAIEPRDKMILGIRISIERSMLVAEQFIQLLITKYGKHHISTDGGT